MIEIRKVTIYISDSSLCVCVRQKVNTWHSKFYYSNIITDNTASIPREKLNNTTTQSIDTLLYWDSTEACKLFGVLPSEVNAHIEVIDQSNLLSNALNTHDVYLQVIVQSYIIEYRDISNYEIWQICNKITLLIIALAIAKTKIQIIKTGTLALHWQYIKLNRH